MFISVHFLHMFLLFHIPHNLHRYCCFLLLSQNALDNAFVSSAVGDMFGMDPEILLQQLEALSSISPQEAHTISTMAELAYNVTECLELDRLEAYDTEEELVQRALELSNKNRVLAGKLSHILHT